MKIIFLQTLFLLFGAFAVHDGHALGSNIARGGKSASQSSTYPNGRASHAVDGNTNGYYGANSCTHTQKTNQPWFKVDLGSTKTVRRVDLYNRIGCCSDRLKNFEIRVGDSRNLTSNPLCISGQDFSHVIVGALMCKTPLAGRYVSVHLAGIGILTLCEVKVYSGLQ